eukprot:CAMPEP_0117426126 /NCGR_PEP_ID=MMETSP0758-20121206/6294_1 /TAXON_ID=63605 /ORGANISM="Percolomonas cosmopolitus, Strain AE-1 (ATCC 50343)" /LENGTH=555 /DNA_ID=CAMNT_0005211091 /DNA_START=265 /DNA_END=1933 /DNA_ORIENTATION=+
MKLLIKGLDTISNIYIDNEKIGETKNAMRRHEFDIEEEIIKGKENITIRIDIESARRYAKKQAEQFEKEKGYNVPCPQYTTFYETQRNFIRKPGCAFGWDWGPAIPNIGIDDMELINMKGAKIDTISVQQKLKWEKNKCKYVKLEMKVHFMERQQDEEGTLVMEVYNEKQEKIIVKTQKIKVVKEKEMDLIIPNPILWNPTGLNLEQKTNPHLYTIKAIYNSKTFERSTKQIKIGIREIQVLVEEKEKGTNFEFLVNRMPVFIRGANWIPTEAFGSEAYRNEKVKDLLKSAKESGMNMIRVWGGGYYESEHFYDLADSMGLLVWQDFAFACALYPSTDHTFMNEVEKEVTYQIKRLQHRTSLVIWAGNNESEEALTTWPEVQNHKRKQALISDYDALFHRLLPQLLETYDKTRHYHPSSPSNGIYRWGNAQDLNSGDSHYWAVWHGGQDFSAYRQVTPRFSSEFGFQSFPSLSTWKEVLENEDDFNGSSVAVTKRQRSYVGSDPIFIHLLREFRFPSSFAHLIYFSQLNQARAIALPLNIGDDRKAIVKAFFIGI